VRSCSNALIGSALLADTGSPTPSLVFDPRRHAFRGLHRSATRALPVAVASGEPPPLPPSLYIHRGDLDTETFQRLAIADQLQQVQADLAQARQQTEQSRQQAEQARHQAEQARQQAEQATERAEQATERAEQARQLVERTTQRAEQAEHARVEWEERGEAVQRRHDLLAGSLRTFLRGYLPRLSRHLFGQRP
jgi:septal ring factor EnvC (AmiA/AmiB activator)